MSELEERAEVSERLMCAWSLSAPSLTHRRHLGHREDNGERSQTHNERDPYCASSAAVAEGEDCHDKGKLPGETEDDDIADDGEESEPALADVRAKHLLSLAMNFVPSIPDACRDAACHECRVPDRMICQMSHGSRRQRSQKHRPWSRYYLAGCLQARGLTYRLGITCRRRSVIDGQGR